MFEGAYKYNQDNGEIPGTIKVGGLHQRLDARGGEIAITGNDPAVRNGDHGLYAILDQMIYRLPGESGPKGVSFGRIVGAPEDRNPVAFYWEGGFTFTGLMPGRPNNILGIAYARAEISNDLAAHVATARECRAHPARIGQLLREARCDRWIGNPGRPLVRPCGDGCTGHTPSQHARNPKQTHHAHYATKPNA
jgi:hypothetical protein